MRRESLSEPTFVMMCCAYGAEQAIKKSIAVQGWRLAFSRPGFVTAKHDEPTNPPHGVFIRTAAISIGNTRNVDGQTQLNHLVEQLNLRNESARVFDQLHVWPKDRAAIGRFGFEPGVDEVSEAVAQEIYKTLAPTHLR
ncbi:MAG: SAM-dependent methyltransferase, partial [Pirellulaceae bacterium]|nr:SAM-dependent methyltransferase [Pirellulaceae bacterium]